MGKGEKKMEQCPKKKQHPKSGNVQIGLPKKTTWTCQIGVAKGAKKQPKMF
jgi:hypothetical protein